MHDINRSLESQKITLIGAAINLILSVAKVTVGIIGQSQALIADGIHSVSDLLSDALVWFAAKHAGEAPDDGHPYGHGRFETAATLGLGIVLLIIATGIILDAISRLFDPENLLQPTFITIVVAALSIVSKEALYWYTIRTANKLHSPMLKANAWHHRSDAISSVIVLIGVVGTILGLPYLDAIAATLVGAMVAYIGWKLGIPALDELVDKGIEVDKLENLKTVIRQVDGVQSLHMLRTRHHGNQVAADLHIQVEPFLSVSEGHMIAVAVEAAAKNANCNIHDVTVHIDPEDDEKNESCAHLPTREKVLRIIRHALVDSQCEVEIEKTGLHYLDGKIHIDIYLPLNCLDHFNSKTLQTKIKSSLNTGCFGKINIYFNDNE